MSVTASDLKVRMSDVMAADRELEGVITFTDEGTQGDLRGPGGTRSLELLDDRGDESRERVSSAPSTPKGFLKGLKKSLSKDKVKTGSVVTPSDDRRRGVADEGAGNGSATGGGSVASASLSRSSKDLTALSMRPILEKELAYLTGALEDGVHPIVTIPETALKQLEFTYIQEELQITLFFFKSLLSAEQQSAGATLLIDCRSSKTHACAKLLLESYASETPPPPLSLHKVCVLMKTPSFFSRAKTLILPEDENKLKLLYFHSTKDLCEKLKVSNVTTSLGGTLLYNHQTWINDRVHYEKMAFLHRKAMDRLPLTMAGLNDFHIPANVKEAEHLMQEDLKLKEDLVNSMAEAEVSIDRFLLELREQNPDLEMRPATKDYSMMTSSLDGMLEELKATQEEFDRFWALHKARVDHMVKMCHFSRTTEKLKHLMEGHIEDLATSELKLGDTLESALELGEKHEAFVTKCKETMDGQMATLREDAQALIHPTFHPEEDEESMHAATREAIATVKDRVQDITQTYQQVMTTCQQKRDMFIVCVKFHMTVRQCQQWNQEVLEFLASQPLVEPTSDVAAGLLSHMDGFLMRMSPEKVGVLKELTNALPGKTFKKLADRTREKFEQARELVERRKEGLLRIMATSLPPPPKPPGFPSPELKWKPPRDSPDGSPKVPVNRTKSAADASLKARVFVFQELVSTEQDYIRDLKTVIDSYYDDMDPEDENSMPLRLRGKREAIFVNLLDIYKFHDSVFSQALEKYAGCPERVGECFLEHSQQFQMYTVYCRSRTNSETLINESTESLAFFKGIQLKLGHALPLNSYLIKPIQRITKYQLLIKDMIKHTSTTGSQKVVADLQTALDRMLKVLKNLNDSLHVVGLKGFPGALAEQGRLLVHDAFQVVESSGRLFQRGRERHVFLFEKVVILSKKIDAPVQRRDRKSDTYIYKSHLELAEVGVRELYDLQVPQFELIAHGQTKGFRFQAESTQVHEMWVKEIRRLLQLQFTLMKDMVIKSGTLDRSRYKGRARMSTLTRGPSLFGDSIKLPPPNQKKSLAERFRKHLKPSRKSEPRITPHKPSKRSLSLQPTSNAYPVTASLPVSALLQPPRDNNGTPDSDQASSLSFSSDEEFTYEFSDEEGDGYEDIAVDHYENLAPGAPRYYIATSAYDPGSDDTGICMQQDQEVEVLGINPYGWWWVRATNYAHGEIEEGWVPASYLQVSKLQEVPGQ